MSLLNIPGKGWYIKDWWEGYNMGSFPSRQKARDWVKEMSGKSIGELNKAMAIPKRPYCVICNKKIPVGRYNYTSYYENTMHNLVAHSKCLPDQTLAQWMESMGIGKYNANPVAEPDPSATVDAHLTQLEKERGEIYGDPYLSHEAIGLAWEALFRNRYQDESKQLSNTIAPGTLFPADLVAAMFVAFKGVRAVRPRFHQDSYDDRKVYSDFEERFRKP